MNGPPPVFSRKSDFPSVFDQYPSFRFPIPLFPLLLRLVNTLHHGEDFRYFILLQGTPKPEVVLVPDFTYPLQKGVPAEKGLMKVVLRSASATEYVRSSSVPYLPCHGNITLLVRFNVFKTDSDLGEIRLYARIPLSYLAEGEYRKPFRLTVHIRTFPVVVQDAYSIPNPDGGVNCKLKGNQK